MGWILALTATICPPLWLESLPLTGGRALPDRILPGPMEGITAGSFCSVMGGLGLVSAWLTPFIRVSEGVLRPSRIRERLRPFSPLPVVAQVMGTDIPRLAETAARLAAEPGVIGIDLNCACPTRIVVSHGGGGGRLRNPAWIRDALVALRRACPAVGISVKVRAGLHSDTELHGICDAVAEGAPDYVVLHYRTVAEGYRSAPHGLQRLARAREYLASLPLFGSGDLHTVEAAARMYDAAGVDGITPARGLLANPWLLRDIQAACRATAAPPTSDEDRRDFLRRLIEDAERTETWRRGFVLEVARHLFGCDHPVFERLLAADSAAGMLSALAPGAPIRAGTSPCYASSGGVPVALSNRFGVEMDTDRMVALFMDAVRVDSESGDEARFMAWLQPKLEALGARASPDAYGNLIAHLPSKGSTAAPILLSCHGDTVKPGKQISPVLANGVIRSGGQTILGADDKAGIAEMIETLQVAPIRPPIEIAISRQEEVGLIGVKNLDFSRISARRGFLLDNDTLDTIITGGPSYFAIDVTVTGKSAHAGMEPEKGINAIQAAARAIAALKIGRLDHETTANVGIISGGMIRNGVPDTCSFAAECRSLVHAKGQAVADEMERVIRREVEACGAQVTIQTNNLCQASFIADDAWTVRTAQQALTGLGIDAKPAVMCGFTDASIYNNHGIEMGVVGIGARQEHSTDEHIYVEDMERAVAMMVAILRLSA